MENDNPFLCYEFLEALETTGCLGEQFGWYPHHLIVRENKSIIAATPLYIKTNSYGEFVFDWSWASAYEQAGISYYPKIISSIPYTPATGRRLLISPSLPDDKKGIVIKLMIQACIDESKRLASSGMHWLFILHEECKYFKQKDLFFRLGCQYHWRNHGYDSFDQFLDTFISRKRKKIKQERRYVREQDLVIKRVHGNEVNEDLWSEIHAFYENTFYRKRGIPTLSLEFFKKVGESIGRQILLILTYNNSRLIACAINFCSSDTLYGRFWGCSEKHNCLHFEACYYQGIEYAIEQKLKSFEPGAQGEHKIGRGFLPTKTWSAHWIADQKFEPAIREFCLREESFMHHECDELMKYSPYHTE